MLFQGVFNHGNLGNYGNYGNFPDAPIYLYFSPQKTVTFLQNCPFACARLREQHATWQRHRNLVAPDQEVPMGTAGHDLSNSNELLNSWKEIAAYLDRGVRTVQRWEIQLGLPVRRPWGKNRSAVIAFRSEIDSWIKSAPLLETAEANSDASQAEAWLDLIASIRQSRELRLANKLLRKELHEAVHATLTTLTKIRSEFAPPPRATSEPAGGVE